MIKVLKLNAVYVTPQKAKQSMKTLQYLKNKTLLFVLTTPLILTACATERIDTKQSTKLIIPPEISYEPKFLDELIVEATSGQCFAHVELGKDYKWTRDKLRVVRAELSND